MSATTIKLPPRLKARIAPLARRSGRSPHAWMLDALAREAEREELREEFIDAAIESARAIDAGAPVYAMEEVHAWLRARVAGKRRRRPRPLK
jgi:predicted transcriptional regulator